MFCNGRERCQVLPRVCYTGFAVAVQVVGCKEQGDQQGSIVTSRKGNGIFQLHIEGKASHAGSAHAQGISTIQELAHQTLYLHGLTDYTKGTTLNVGVARGCSRFNVVAAEAEAMIDLRVTDMDEAERIVPMLTGLKPHGEGIQIKVTGGLNRPPMLRSEQTLLLFDIVDS